MILEGPVSVSLVMLIPVPIAPVERRLAVTIPVELRFVIEAAVLLKLVIVPTPV